MKAEIINIENDTKKIIEIRKEVQADFYRDYLMQLDDDELAHEFSEKIGNFMKEVESIFYHKGRLAVIDYLSDSFEASL